MLTNDILFKPFTNGEKKHVRALIRAIDKSELRIPNHPDTCKERALVKDLIHCLEFRCYDLDDFIRNIDFLVVVYQDGAYCKELEEYGLAICKEVHRWRST